MLKKINEKYNKMSRPKRLGTATAVIVGSILLLPPLASVAVIGVAFYGRAKYGRSRVY